MEERGMTEEHPVEHEESQDGNGREPADYETELTHYLQARIKPGLSRSAIPLVARSIAKEIARHEPSGQPPSSNPAEGGGDATEAGNEPVPDFEEEMHELQEELGDDWILHFSVHGDDGWLTAEKQDSSQRVEAATADHLLRIVDAIEPKEDDEAVDEE
jgi:hypothetical protein